MIKAEIVADSRNKFGNRITTFVLQFPRIVLAEFNTHRMISRNSASSRAIPFAKMLQRVEENPFIPIAWMKDHSGMQGNEYFTNDNDINRLKTDWLIARDNAVRVAKSLSEFNLTKQVVNRLLEPFMWHTVICTGTEWENFFALRAHPAAEIHIAKLAELMLEAYNTSTPKLLNDGEWHIPFGDNFSGRGRDLDKILGNEPEQSTIGELTDLMIKIATARCARVSYLNFEGKDDYVADIKLHDTLKQMGHMSPFEHCAKAMTSQEYRHYHMHSYNSGTGDDKDLGFLGNFRGFIQYRKMINGENKTDERVLKFKLDTPLLS